MEADRMEKLLSCVNFKSPKLKEVFDNELLKNLLCNGFEGGIGYWCEEVVSHNKKEVGAEYYHESPVLGGWVKLKVDDLEYTLDRKSIDKGIETFVKKYHWHCSNALTENDDAETADVFIQCCLFGEIIYG